MKRFAMCALLLTLAMPAFGQGDFTSLLSGKDYPLSMKLNDLTADYRHMLIGGTDGKGGGGDMLSQLMQAGMSSGMGKGKGGDELGGAMGMGILGMLFGGMGGGSSEPVYYSKGQTVSIGGETFLVAYSYQKKGLDLMSLIADSEKNGGKEPDFAKLAEQNKITGDTPVTLSLVNVKMIGTMRGLRPFDLAQELAEAAQGGGGLMEMLGQKEAVKDNSVIEPAEAAAPAPAKPVPAKKSPAKPGVK